MAKTEFFQLATRLGELLSQQNIAIDQAEGIISANTDGNSATILKDLEKSLEPLRTECASLQDALTTTAEANQNMYFVKIFDAHARRLNKMEIDVQRRWNSLVNQFSRSTAADTTAVQIPAYGISPSRHMLLPASAVATLDDTQERSIALRRIEEDIHGLNHVFRQMNTLVENQERTIYDIEQQSGVVVDDTTRANQELDRAVVSGRLYRKTKWRVFGIGVLIVIATGIVLAIVFGVLKKH